MWASEMFPTPIVPPSAVNSAEREERALRPEAARRSVRHGRRKSVRRIPENSRKTVEAGERIPSKKRESHCITSPPFEKILFDERRGYARRGAEKKKRDSVFGKNSRLGRDLRIKCECFMNFQKIFEKDLIFLIVLCRI